MKQKKYLIRWKEEFETTVISTSKEKALREHKIKKHPKKLIGVIVLSLGYVK